MAVPNRPSEPAPSPIRVQAHSPAARPSLAGRLEGIADRVRADVIAKIRGAEGTLLIGVAMCGVVAAAHLARLGTPRARIVAAGLFLFGVAAVPLLLGLPRRRRIRTTRGVLRLAAEALVESSEPVGSDLVERAILQVDLAERIERDPAHEGVSPALARLHAHRSLDRLSMAGLAAFGETKAKFRRRWGLVLVVVGMAGLAISPGRFIEGLDVAFARGGVAPLALLWLTDTQLTVSPPKYLHLPDASTSRFGSIRVHRGGEISIRGQVRRAGRALSLTDGTIEVPFVDDGQGSVVARWPVSTPASLRIRARFGEVVIDEPEGWELGVIEDESPVVTLEGAPKTVEIAKMGGSISLRYDAKDDHGLREVHLVIRVGTHEERRVLAKLEAEPIHDRGGYVLRTKDKLIEKARTPVHLRIEARDNDPITGPKWGKSPEIVLMPPVVGASEAARYEAFLAQRDALVDVLGEALEKPEMDPVIVSGTFEKAASKLDTFLGSEIEGLRVPPRVAMLLRGRLRKVREALDAEMKAASTSARAVTVESLQSLVLAADATLRGLASKDARTIAKTLAEIADEGAEAVKALATTNLAASLPAALPATSAPATSAPGNPDEKLPKATAKDGLIQSRDISVTTLNGGGGSLRRLGDLGRDLGEIVENDLRRVQRMSVAKDFVHEELSFRDLAARLREPVPSFSGGGGGGGGGGEPSEESDEGEGAAGDEAAALDELAKEHGGAKGEVEDLLRQAEDPKSLEGLDEEAKKRAKELRDLVKGLPKAGGLRKNLESAESSVREKAEAMAEALERLQVGDAKERGDSALKALEDARDRAWMRPGSEGRHDAIESGLKKQIDWLEDTLKTIRKEAGKRAESKVKSVAPREKGIAERAKELGDASERKAPLPGPIKELLDQAEKKMRDAANALEKGDVEDAQKAQREAQKLLESARDSAQGKHDDESGGDEGDKRFDPDDKVDVPKADDHKGPEAFRKRVLEGLGSASGGKLKDAIKRYAEGLIQ